MSQSSHIVLGFPQSTVEPARAVGEIFKLAGAAKASWADRSIGESREYDRFLAYLRDEIDDPDVESVRIKGRLGPRRVAASARDGTCLRFSLDDVTLLDVLTRRIEGRIEEAVRGDCSVDGVSARVGDHDIFTIVRDKEDSAVLLGRYPISICHGFSRMPNDPKTFLDKLLNIDEFADFVSRAEAIFGKSEARILLYY